MKPIAAIKQLLAAIAVGGVLVAALLFPVIGGAGYASSRAAEALTAETAAINNGLVPTVSTVRDATGKPIAWLYDQYRVEVEPDAIAQPMKDAIVAIEDRRFYEHDGVDWLGTMRAALANFTAGSVQQGASTLEQQYIKNYTLLVSATTPAEQRAATATSYTRKLREIRLAQDLDDQMSKEEVLTRYLNIVPFGNGAYGIQAAAQTYFGKDAKDLEVPEAAMLAGMVQSSSALNPFTAEEDVKKRRNLVLDAMVANGALTEAGAAQHKNSELGVLDKPKRLPRGCISSGDRAFFCDYALEYLESHGLPLEDILRGGYDIKTTLDPQAQDSVSRALATYADPKAKGVAEVMNLIEPGQNSRRVLAMGSSRTYGLNQKDEETVQPQPHATVGHGAGSVFKIFTAAAALQKGAGLNQTLSVPRRYEATGMGHGGADNCPPNTYCVENAGSYRDSMTLQDALAHSPNTTFVQLAEWVGIPAVVDMAVKLGLRSYDDPGTYNGDMSVAQYWKDSNLGSFTLGPTAVDNLELSNVAATLASHGKWCEPSPIDSVTDRDGKPVKLKTPACDQAVSPQLADTLAVGLSKDTVSGTAAGAAGTVGWSGPVAAKTGTTESHQSSAFLAFTGKLAGSTYIYNDSPTASELCAAPLRQCPSGNLFGGKEPALTWLNAVAPLLPTHGGASLPQADPKMLHGTQQPSGAVVPIPDGGSDGDDGDSSRPSRDRRPRGGQPPLVIEIPGLPPITIPNG
ncbi:transglycosylase domain-containing protein [Corynebacterium ulceribovis]|uniref:transglycosylase domain-containing protein n=1 Tax=Corynebacterium ulceribovis TaxID=487732 RepID=UPI00035EA786|nr:transglycosylase domain-containing protein [Corynebacterium ulceribovis]